MRQDLFETIIQECSKHSEVQRIIPYLMNEPLCDPGIVEKINYAKDLNPRSCVHIITNGTLFCDAISNALTESRADWIGISIHAIYPETYAAISGHADGAEVIARIDAFAKQALKKRGTGFVMVNLVRDARFIEDSEVQQAFAHWKGLGVSRLEYYGAPISRAGNIAEMYRIRHSRINGCKTIWNNESLCILQNGDAILCCMDWQRELLVGNVRAESIEEIWNGKRRENILAKIFGRVSSAPDFICKRCEDAIPLKKEKPVPAPTYSTQQDPIFKQNPRLWFKSWQMLLALLRGNTVHFARGLNYFRALEYPLALYLVCQAPSGPVLDVGSGDDDFAFYLARSIKNQIHLAKSPEGAAGWLLHYRSHIHSDPYLYRRFRKGKLLLEVFPAENIPYPNDHFATITAISVIEHNHGMIDAEIINELERVLKPGGQLIISFPVAWNGFFEQGQPGTENYTKFYDRNALEKHLLFLPQLSLIHMVHFGERDPQIGRLWSRLPVKVRSILGLAQSIIAPLLWKVYRISTNLDSMDDVSRLHRAGVVMVVLEKRLSC